MAKHCRSHHRVIKPVAHFLILLTDFIMQCIRTNTGPTHRLIATIGSSNLFRRDMVNKWLQLLAHLLKVAPILKKFGSPVLNYDKAITCHAL